jgi:hypothetical protein
MLTALLPMLGVIIGAGLQYFFSRSGERRKHLEALKSQAYVDYMRCVAQLAKVERGDIKKFSELSAETADAKTRVCMYGSTKVIRTLADFAKGGSVLDSPDSFERFLEICHEVRRENFGDAGAVVAPEDLSIVLFGPER